MEGIDRSRELSGAGERVRRLVMGRGRTLIAALAYDTRSQALPRGVRTLNQSERRLLYLADDYEILLKVTVDPATGLPRLTGQILADGLPATRAAVQLSDSQAGRRQAVDDDGGFRVVAPRPDVFRLEVDIGPDRVEVPNVDLRDRDAVARTAR